MHLLYASAYLCMLEQISVRMLGGKGNRATMCLNVKAGQQRDVEPGFAQWSKVCVRVTVL